MTKSWLYGVLSGVLIIALYLIVYFFDKAGVVSVWLYLVSFVPVLIFQWKAADLAPPEEKESLRTWLRYPFAVFMVSSALYYALYLTLLYNDAFVADLWFDARDSLAQRVFGDRFDASQAIRTLPSTRHWLFRFIFGLLGGFILSAIITQIKRSRK